jgi:hypothetical protein
VAIFAFDRRSANVRIARSGAEISVRQNEANCAEAGSAAARSAASAARRASWGAVRSARIPRRCPTHSRGRAIAGRADVLGCSTRTRTPSRRAPISRRRARRSRLQPSPARTCWRRSRLSRPSRRSACRAWLIDRAWKSGGRTAPLRKAIKREDHRLNAAAPDGLPAAAARSTPATRRAARQRRWMLSAPPSGSCSRTATARERLLVDPVPKTNPLARPSNAGKRLEKFVL